MSYVVDSTMRACDGPGCPAAYDAMTGPTESAGGYTWTIHKSFGLHMCPSHTAAYWGHGAGPHVPSMDDSGVAACSCGQSLPGPTRGDMKTAYAAHLEEIA